jgi:hypothetical protein
MPFFKCIFKDLLTNLNMRFWFFSKRESSKPPTYQTKLTSFEKNCDNVRRSLSIVLILWYRGLYDTTVFTFYTIAQLQRHLVADLFWYSGVPTYTLTIHSLSRVVVPATLHSISVNAHFTRFL